MYNFQPKQLDVISPITSINISITAYSNFQLLHSFIHMTDNPLQKVPYYHFKIFIILDAILSTFVLLFTLYYRIVHSIYLVW